MNNLKTLIRKKHPYLTEYVLMNSCFIHYNAKLVEFVSVVEHRYSFCQDWLVFCQFPTPLSLRNKLYQWRYSLTINLSVSVWKSTDTFDLRFYFVHFRQNNSSLESFVSHSGICCISTEVSERFSGEIFGVVFTTWWSANFDFSLRKRFLISDIPAHPDLWKKW